MTVPRVTAEGREAAAVRVTAAVDRLLINIPDEIVNACAVTITQAMQDFARHILTYATPLIAAAERERCAQLAETHGATYPALAPIGRGEGVTIGSGPGYQQVPFAPLLREGPS